MERMKDRSDLVRELVSEYKANGEQGAIKLFNSMIKRYELSQFGIRTIILEFREAIGIKVG